MKQSENDRSRFRQIHRRFDRSLPRRRLRDDRGTSEQVTVNSDQPGAFVETTAGLTCSATRCTWKVPCKQEFVATFTLDGYELLLAIARRNRNYEAWWQLGRMNVI